MPLEAWARPGRGAAPTRGTYEGIRDYLDATAAGQFSPPIHQVYEGLEQVAEAHRIMEANRAVGKLVVRVRHPA